jgi:hypothetical protein
MAIIGQLATDQQKEAAKKCVKTILTDLLYLYKNEEYKTEGELRTISFHPQGDSLTKLDEGSLEDGVKHEFVETPPFLFECKDCEIIIGPKVINSYAVQVEIEHLLRDREYNQNVIVKKSEISYR